MIAGTKLDRSLQLAGVPQRYWHVDFPTPVSFSYPRFGNPPGRLSLQPQQEWLAAFQKDPLRLTHPYLISITSNPTDDLAKATAFTLLRMAYVRGLKVAVIDTGDVTELPACDLAVIHGMIYPCPSERTQTVKDCVNRYRESLVLLVASGTDPVTFASTTVRTFPDVAFYFEGLLSNTLIL